MLSENGGLRVRNEILTSTLFSFCVWVLNQNYWKGNGPFAGFLDIKVQE